MIVFSNTRGHRRQEEPEWRALPAGRSHQGGFCDRPSPADPLFPPYSTGEVTGDLGHAVTHPGLLP